MTSQPYDRFALEIRSKILASPGAQRCDTGQCQVITQGGLKGMAEHKKVVHGDTNWRTS